MGAGGEPLRARLEPHASSVAQARRFVRAALTSGGRADLLDAAEVATSELVTNAVVHTGRPVELSVVLLPAGLRVEVADESTHLPAPRAYGPAAGTGRGLLMVDQLVHAWGIDRRPDGAPGKVVWFELGQEDLGERSDLPVEQAEGASVQVRLLGVPLLVHATWQQQAEALLREHLLVGLDRDGGDDAVQVHADASDALALLAEHLPVLGPGEEVADDARRVADLTMPVPLSAVAHFRSLDKALDDAVAAAVEGRFLTAPTHPELQEYRRWVCRQVGRQSCGGEPERWGVSQAPPGPAHSRPPGPVTDLPETRKA